MANEQNLAKGKRISEEIARDYQEQSVKSRNKNTRRKKTILQIMDMVERCPLNEIGKADLKRGGLDLSDLDPDDLTAMDGAVAGMYIAARRGNHKAFEQLARYKDQQRKDRLEIEKLKAEIEKLKEGLRNQADIPDDGFTEAIKGTAANDWGDKDV